MFSLCFIFLSLLQVTKVIKNEQKAKNFQYFLVHITQTRQVSSQLTTMNCELLSQNVVVDRSHVAGIDSIVKVHVASDIIIFIVIKDEVV